MRISPRATRPSYKDDFELVLFRWKYLNKTSNPSKETLDKYYDVIKSASDRAFGAHNATFKEMGFEIEDIKALASIHAVSYIGLFSLDVLSNKKAAFISRFTDKNGAPPDLDELDKYDKSSAYRFLVQRLRENALVCYRKLQSINGAIVEKRYFLGPNKNQTVAKHFIPNHESLGFVEITKEEARDIYGAPVTSIYSKTKDNRWIRTIKIRKVHKTLSSGDLWGSLFSEGEEGNDKREDFIKDEFADDLIVEIETMVNNKIAFEKMTSQNKLDKLNNFLRKNKKNSKMSDEVELAISMIEQLQAECLTKTVEPPNK